MKKITAILLVLLLCVLPLVSCEGAADDGKIKIVCSIFPVYDWVRCIVGDADGVEVSLLVSDGSDPHSYNAGVADIVAISSCDLLVTVGGDSDAWINAALRDVQNKELSVLRLLDILDERELAYTADSEHEHSHTEGEDCHHTLDEHIWLSPKAALLLCESIYEALLALDASNADIYGKNFDAYRAELSSLDALYTERAETADKPFIFADRFPFKYLFCDYSLDYIAAFSSCSADSEASFSTVISLANEIGANGLDRIFVTESAIDGIAESVISASGRVCEIVAIDSLQSVTAREAEDGASYVEIMKQNAELLFE